MTTADDSVYVPWHGSHQSCETSPKAHCAEFISILFHFNAKPTLTDQAPLTLQHHEKLGTGFSSLHHSPSLFFTVHIENTPLCSCAILLRHVWWAQINHLYLFLSDWALTPLPGSLQSPEGEPVFQCPEQAQPRKQKERRGGLKQRNAGVL